MEFKVVQQIEDKLVLKDGSKHQFKHILKSKTKDR